MKTIIPKAWEIPEIFRQRMGQSVGRQRLMSEEGHHLLVLHEIPQAWDKGLRSPALFWINDLGEWKSMPERGGWSALKEHVQRYQSRAANLDEELESLDGFETASEIHRILDLATPLHKAARNMANVVQDMRKAMPENRDILELRDIAVATELVSELLVTDAKSSFDYLIAKSAFAQAKEARKSAKEAQKLNRLAAIFFPLVTIASFFGMNPPGDVFKNGGLFILCIAIVAGLLVWRLIDSSDKNV